MKLQLDAESPLPLYHQIAESIRYAIATGRLRPGDPLPPVREAARQWGVNLHTVRQGYRELARGGLVTIRRREGCRVRAGAGRAGAGAATSKLERFLERTLTEARERHGIGRWELARRLADRHGGEAPVSGPVCVVECSEPQARGHASEISERWEVEAEPWSLQRNGEPPPGPVIATYFHYNDVRRRWPHRLHEIRFAAIRPDPALRRALEPFGGRGRLAVDVFELDEAMARNVAADLSRILPEKRFELRTRVLAAGGRLPRLRSAVGVLPPRVWARHAARRSAGDRYVPLRYLFEPEELDALGEHFGWRGRKGAA